MHNICISAVVHERTTLGSDGEESIQPSPCTSDETATGASPDARANGHARTQPHYVVNVKMRQKTNRKWSEVL